MNKGLPVGKTLDAGRYTIKSVLGTGGFSVTYLVVNRLGKRFTVKEFFVDGHGKREVDGAVRFEGLPEQQLRSLKEKFETEGRLLLKLEAEKHRNIVRPVEFFSENNTHYLVLEYIEGVTLSEIIKSGGPLKMREASDWVLQIGAALGTLHRLGIYHLDVKPANIIIDAQGQAVLIDFGLCKEAQKKGDGSLTTLAYSSGFAPPEQETGQGRANARMDVFAFAATCHFMLTGIKPDAPGLVARQAFSDSDLWLVDALENGLSADPARRQESVFAFLEDLRLANDDRTKFFALQKTATVKTKKIKPSLMAVPVLAACFLVAIYFFGQENGTANSPMRPSAATLADTADSQRPAPGNPARNVGQPQPSGGANNNPGNGKPPVETDPASTPESTSKYSYTWQGKIQKSTGNKEFHQIKLEYNKGRNGELDGICTVSEANDPAAKAIFKIVGSFSSDGTTENLHVETISALAGGNMKFCLFSGDFFHEAGTNRIKARFKPNTGTASGNSCSPYRTNSDFVLEKK